MLSTDAIVDSLALEDAGPDRWRVRNVDSGHGVVFGGQLMAQALVAGLHGLDGMTAKTVHTVFARGGRPDAGLDVSVERVNAGRTFATAVVTLSQSDRVCTTSTVLAHADEPDLMRHAEPVPQVVGPDDAIASRETEAGAAGEAGWEVRVVDGVDVNDPDAVGPAELAVWTRFVGAPDDPVLSQALLAFASDGFLIGTAMRPHAGVGQAQAHRTLSTGVISHTITFHEPFRASDWMLLVHRSPYAGRGRTYGRADVFDPAGQLVASFVQDAMVRPMPDGSGQRL
jgi:acyl-CoA thioesterase II